MTELSQWLIICLGGLSGYAVCYYRVALPAIRNEARANRSLAAALPYLTVLESALEEAIENQGGSDD